MDLRQYYEKLKAIKNSIHDEFVVLVSRETPEGGKPGVFTEAPRALAARLMSEGRAELANEEQVAAFRESTAEAKRKADGLVEASKMRVVVLPSTSDRSKRGRGSR
jgi:hypothetical protein